MNAKPVIAYAFFILIGATALFALPPKASAQFTGGSLGCIGGALGAFTSFLGVPISSLGVSATAGATTGDCINNIVLKPLARNLLNQFLKTATASVINFITGKSGNNQPSFVRNLSVHQQAVGDSAAVPFINQIQKGLNPMFASSIATSLLRNYAQGSSIGGFFAANQSTLGRSSPNPPAFAAGDWSKGGIPSWFALTTQDENNPYIQAAASKRQLDQLVSQAQSNRQAQLAQSNGLLSWCGTSSSGSGSSGISPSASCRNSDGTEGNVQTPGIVIRDYTEQALGAEFAQIINPVDIDAALAAIFGAALNTGINSILGSSGLFGASFSTSIRPTSVTGALLNSASSNASAINTANAAANAALVNLTAYTTAWTSVANAASAAQLTVSSLRATCTNQVSNADAALATIQSVLTQAQQSINSVSGTQALALQVQQDALDTTTAGLAKLNTDMETLAAAPPSESDLATAQASAAVTGGATANPAGSLTVSGGSLLDQMNLLNQNATGLMGNPTACTLIT